MPRNSLNDLNNLLFGQLELLADNEITGEDLDNEIKRSEAMSNIAETIVESAKLELSATKLLLDNGYAKDANAVALMITGGNNAKG